MRMKGLAICLSAVLIIGAGILTFRQETGLQGESLIAKVDGVPIEYREYQLILQDLRSTTPPEKLKELALKSLTAIKVEQAWAKEKGLIDDLSYSSELKRWKQENERRNQAVRQKKPIYGPIQYDERGFYEYELSNLRIRLKEAVSKQDYKISDDVLKTRYEAIKEQQFKKPDTIQLWKVAIPDQDGKGKERMKQASDKLAQGEDFKQIAQSYAIDGKGWELSIHADNQKQISETAPILFEEALKLPAGQQSPVFEENGTLFIVKCAARTQGGYEPFEQVKRQVSSFYVEEKYKEEVERRTQAARTEIVQTNLDKVKIT